VYKFLVFSLYLLSVLCAQGQEFRIRGSVKDATTAAGIPEVRVQLTGTSIETTTDASGSFELTGELAAGDYNLSFSASGYFSLQLPVTLNPGSSIELDYIPLEIDLAEANQNLTLISLSDLQLNNEEQRDDILSPLLSATNDAFGNAAAFDFSSTFFRPRGLDSQYSSVLINGIKLNKLSTGRPQWSNWGGLNDVMRNREFTPGIAPGDYSFSGPAGTLHFDMNATALGRGGRVSYAQANRSYTGRIMASYNSGLSQNGWAYSILASRRFGNEGYIEGTLYDANSFFAAVEKQLSEKHSLNLTAIYTPNRRGRSTALTQEVLDLKGNQYNPNWGYQDGKIRNARLREIDEPLVILSHHWKFSSRNTLTSSVAYQWGKTSNSRIDNTGSTLFKTENGTETFLGGARNPAPNYYQNLPGYFLRFPNPTAANYQNAYLAREAFVEDGQLDWGALYHANRVASETGLNAVYAIQNDVNQDRMLQIASILNIDLSQKLKLTARLSATRLKSENYAELDDLMGGSIWLDIDSFAEDDATTGGDLAQSDLQNRNRLVEEGDRYKYNYNILASELQAFLQLQATLKRIDAYAAIELQQTRYQREGFYENGYYPGKRSLGKSNAVAFFTPSGKAGLTYKFSGKHFALLNAGLLTQPLPYNTVFTNARQNNDILDEASAEQITNLDLSYIYRSPSLKLRLTGYLVDFKQGSELSFFYTGSLQSPQIEQGNALVQEITTGINRRNLGAEFGLEFKALPTLTFKAVAAYGNYQYTSDPQVYYTTTLAQQPVVFGEGNVKLKNYHVAGGPEQAYQLGFDYRDPDFWWLGASFNRFADAYIDVSYLRRSGAFSTDFDGLPFNDYDCAQARVLLQQEKISPYNLVNLVGGKSWRVKDYTIGFFGLVNNLLNMSYKTGAFEDSRVGDYRSLLEESRRELPLFGNRYFTGYGTTFYVNVYARF